MRAAGTLLTVLALLAVQAPWIACHCDGDTSLTSLLTGVLVHPDTVHEQEHGHAHACCDGVAHAVHGSGHAHGRHCHGTFAHTHGGTPSDGEKAPTERHDGFRLALRTLPSDADFGAPDVRVEAGPALLQAQAWFVQTIAALADESDPPERCCFPASATERLLL